MRSRAIAARQSRSPARARPTGVPRRSGCVDSRRAIARTPSARAPRNVPDVPRHHSSAARMLSWSASSRCIAATWVGTGQLPAPPGAPDAGRTGNDGHARSGVAARDQPFPGVLADGFEQAVRVSCAVFLDDERLVDEMGQSSIIRRSLDVAAAHLLRRLQRESAGEHRQPPRAGARSSEAGRSSSRWRAQRLLARHAVRRRR